MSLFLRHILPDMIKNQRSGDFAADIYEKDNGIMVKMHVPGVRPDKIDISVENNYLHIRGEREDEREVADDQYYHREIRVGKFERVVALPSAVDQEGIRAEYKHGVLRIFLPKKHAGGKVKVSVVE